MTEQELERIYAEAYKPVYWTAIQLLKNEADAEDVIQDTFVAFIESYDDMKDTSKAVALLKKIAANKCLDRIKLTRTDNMEDEFFDSIEAVSEDFLPDSIIESEDARRIIMDIISSSLSEDIRRTLILFYFDELSTKEIAEMLGVPEGTVRRRLNFARNKIKKEVEKYENENGTKLFGMALPFLSKLFIKEAEQVPFREMPASIRILSASARVSQAEAAIKASATAAKTGAGIMKTAIITGVIAAVVSAGITTGIVLGVVSKKNDNNPANTSIEATTVQETTTAEETTTVEETTTTEETTTVEETTTEETTTSEETTTTETKPSTVTAAVKKTTEKPVKKSSVPTVPKGYKKLYWGKKFKGHKVYLVYKYGKGTISYKGYWKGAWISLDYDEASDGYECWTIGSGKYKYTVYYEID
jgi:RNA polymerase sigma factor (sigma-70 family)